MNYIDVVSMINTIEDTLFNEMKAILLEKYISFSIIDNEHVTKEMVSEKLCDYIEKTMIKTGKTFDELLKYYMENLGDLVEPYLAAVNGGKDSKGKTKYVYSRAMKYFYRVQPTRKEKNPSFAMLEDYSRIIFCLYAEIIKRKRQPITDFNFSFINVKCQVLINALESEETKKKIFKHDQLNKRFKIEKYNVDSYILILSIMMLYYLKSREVRGDY